MRVTAKTVRVPVIAILAGIAVCLSVAVYFRPVSEITRLEVVGESPSHVMLSVTYSYTGSHDPAATLVPSVLLDGRLVPRTSHHASRPATPGRHTTWVSVYIRDGDKPVTFQSTEIVMWLLQGEGTIAGMSVPHRKTWEGGCDGCAP